MCRLTTDQPWLSLINSLLTWNVASVCVCFGNCLCIASKTFAVRDRPMIRKDLQINNVRISADPTTHPLIRTFTRKKIGTSHNDYRISRCTDYFPDQNLNRQPPQTHPPTEIRTTVQTIERSLIDLLMKAITLEEIWCDGYCRVVKLYLS